MLDINLLRTNPEVVKENIRKRVRFIYNSSLVYQTPVGRDGQGVPRRDSAGGHPAQPD